MCILINNGVAQFSQYRSRHGSVGQGRGNTGVRGITHGGGAHIYNTGLGKGYINI